MINDQGSVASLADLLIQHRAWSLIDDLAQRGEGVFNTDPTLLYTLAHSLRAEGKTEQSQKTADRAFQLVGSNLDNHKLMGSQLKRLGLFDAAEREYQHVIEKSPQDTDLAIEAQGLLAEMLHDQERELEAAQILQKQVTAAEKDATVLKRLKEFGGEDYPDKERGQMHYYYACHQATQGKETEQKYELDQGAKYDPTNADILIGLYDTSANDPARRKQAMDLIHASDKLFREAIALQPADPLQYNQDAWLIGNTEGDFDLAIQYSQTSLELLRNQQDELRTIQEPGFLDTLAHCYAGERRFGKRREIPGAGCRARSPHAANYPGAGKIQITIGKKSQREIGKPMKHVQVGDVKLAVYTGGEKGHPLLLVHGFPLDHTIWQPQIDFFIDHCRVIAPDLRGFGGSDVTPGTVTMEQMADDLAGLLEALGVHEKVIFCGLSMGGYVGWQFWKKHRHKVSAMIACDTRAVADSAEAAAGRRVMANRVLSEGATAASSVMMPRMFAPDAYQAKPDMVRSVQQMMERQKPEGIAAAALGLAAREDVLELLPTIDVPSLVVVGQHDTISTVDEMRKIADAIPDAVWVDVPQAGHLANVENPAVVNEAIAEFITL